MKQQAPHALVISRHETRTREISSIRAMHPAMDSPPNAVRAQILKLAPSANLDRVSHTLHGALTHYFGCLLHSRCLKVFNATARDAILPGQDNALKTMRGHHIFDLLLGTSDGQEVIVQQRLIVLFVPSWIIGNAACDYTRESG